MTRMNIVLGAAALAFAASCFVFFTEVNDQRARVCALEDKQAQFFPSANRAFTFEAQPLAASSFASHSSSCRSASGVSMRAKVPLSFRNRLPLVTSSL